MARTSPHYPGGAQTEHPSKPIVNHLRGKNKGGQEVFVKKNWLSEIKNPSPERGGDLDTIPDGLIWQPVSGG